MRARICAAIARISEPTISRASDDSARSAVARSARLLCTSRTSTGEASLLTVAPALVLGPRNPRRVVYSVPTTCLDQNSRGCRERARREGAGERWKRCAQDVKKGGMFDHGSRPHAHVLWLLPLCLGLACTRTPARPNIVLVVVDTLRADHLRCYGYARPTSPSLDALATSALLFEDAVAPASFTEPSVATMLTGLEPPA